MPRPQKMRTVYQLPVCRSFLADPSSGDISLTLDELEAIRLTDQEGLDQSACAERLHVARSTAQNILRGARGKVADALVNGKSIHIAGGNVEYSDDSRFGCCRWEFRSVPAVGGINGLRKEGKETMNVAVTYEKETGDIFQHFGRTEYFKVYELDGGRIAGSRVVSTNGQGHGALAGVLKELKADALICGGIGGGARMALDSVGIQLFPGCTGSADDAVSDFLAGKLSFDPNAHCDHHDHEEEHGCGGEGHGCCH